MTHAPYFDLVLAAGLHPEDAVFVAPVLAKLGAPIVAEATANLHLFRELNGLIMQGGERALLAANPSSILRVGAVPSWRFWRDLEHKPEIAVWNFTHAPFPGLARKENVVTHSLEALQGFVIEARQPKPAEGGVLPDWQAFPLSEPSWMHHLAAALPAGARVFLGNSLPIREFNLACGSHIAPGVHFYANRGANGIDGLISTFLGVAASHDGESWLILGDLSALYDLAAPWIISQLANRRIRIVIINNGGGKIFSRVASLRELPEKAREVIENRHAMNFEPFAQLWGLHYQLISGAAELPALPDEPSILEIRPDADQTEAFWAAWQARR